MGWDGGRTRAGQGSSGDSGGGNGVVAASATTKHSKQAKTFVVGERAGDYNTLGDMQLLPLMQV